jgi:Ni,Fe-hydrogenase III large subunit
MSTLGIAPGKSIRLRDLPRQPVDLLRRTILDAVASGHRIIALMGVPDVGGTGLLAVLGSDRDGRLALARSEPVPGSYRAITPECPQAHLFEREIAETWKIVPEGHPWLRPVRVTPSPGDPDPGGAGFFRVDGEEVHEVAVGPVHAGIIEPGHFRFQCHGERVLFLEIALGYQHRGVERALVGGPNARTIHVIETLAGDTTIGHALAHVQAVEALAGEAPPRRAETLRGVALELERLANHVGDLGALAGDVGYLPTAAFCGRLRGDFLNLTARLCGSRLGRGLVRPGGVAWDLTPEEADGMRAAALAALGEVGDAAGLLWGTSTVRARFEETGPVSLATCETLGLVGPPARACGVMRDVRAGYPSGVWREHPIEIASAATGDVQARAWVRWLEIGNSVRWLAERLVALPPGPIRSATGPLAPDSIAVSLVEGWRGEICHVAITDEAGSFGLYKVIDPSFHNWSGLAVAMRDQQISDFPLCNKSFNLSYCGHDL